MNKPAASFLILLTSIASLAAGQHAFNYSGKVVDAQNQQALYFATISLIGAPLGTTTDIDGLFHLTISEKHQLDTLIVTYIGYSYLKIPVNQLDSFTLFGLQALAVNLDEVLVLPLKPEEYIKRAVKKIKLNYPSTPYQALAYYKEKFTENGSFIKQEEAIFKSHHFTVNDSNRIQHQVVLHRKVSQVKELQFMRDKIEKEYQKEVKEAKKKGDTAAVEPPDLSMEKIFGGPNMILALNLKNGLPEFLDTNNLNRFKYSFEPSTSFLGRDIIQIAYQSKGQFEHMRSKGQILLDANTYAIVRLTYKGELVIPVLVKPLLLLLGLRIIDPVVSYQTDYQLFDEYWYPKNFWWTIDSKLVKTHLFSANERSTFHIGQVYVVNNIQNEDISAIPKEKRYTAKKKMQDQVKPEKGIDWLGY